MSQVESPFLRTCGFCGTSFDRTARYWSLYCSDSCYLAATSGLDERVREMLEA